MIAQLSEDFEKYRDTITMHAVGIPTILRNIRDKYGVEITVCFIDMTTEDQNYHVIAETDKQTNEFQNLIHHQFQRGSENGEKEKNFKTYGSALCKRTS